MKQHKRSGAHAFHEFYGELFGERWPVLAEALRSDSRQIAYSHNLLAPYYLDQASVDAARALPLANACSILDLCAAPGGKSLVLAGSMPGDATLVANERSSSRRARLHRVLDAHLPAAIRTRVTVTGHDARKWGMYEKNAYDAVLLDAPCSSEQHLLQSPGHLEKWSAARTRNLAAQAYAMLASAVDACVPGGYVLYSTCALSPVENDGVVDRIVEGRRRVSVIRSSAGERPEFPPGEETRHGVIILPDVAAGRGPIYRCLLQKDSA